MESPSLADRPGQPLHQQTTTGLSSLLSSGQQRGNWRLVMVLAAVIVALYVFDHQLTQTLPLLGFYWLPVLLATSFATLRQVALLNLLALLLAVASGIHLGFLDQLPGEYPLRLLAVTAIGLASIQITHSRLCQERRLIQANHQLNATIRAVPDLLFEVDRQGTFLQVHALQAEKLLLPAEQLMGNRLDQVLPPAAAHECLQALAEAEQSGFSMGRQICLPLASGEHWFELSIARKSSTRGDSFTYMVLSRDIQDRKQAETALRRQISFYRVLSRCTRAIEASGNRTELLQAVCRQAVSTGDLTMAWAGLANPDTAMVEPVAMAGEGLVYLQGIQISADPSTPYGQGPTGRCMRSGQPFWCQDFCNDPVTAPWHERARQCGWGASASLPLRCGGQVVGAINLYAPAPGAFTKEIKALLLDMVVDVDLALERFRRQDQQHQAQLALERSEHDYRQLTETIHDVIWRLDAHTLATTYVSPAVQKLLGYRLDELQDQPFRITLHSDSYPWLSTIRSLALQQLQSTGEQAGSEPYAEIYRVDELRQRHRDGSTVWCEFTSSLARSRVTGALEFYCVGRDITARKQAESQLEWLAYYDRLTELPNRTLIHNLFDQALRTARRADQPVALLALGLDHFRAINDAIGYGAGDVVLLEVSRRLRRNLRDNDLIGRIGNDEFLLVLPGASASKAAQLCERLQEAVRLPISHQEQSIRITSSIGVALFPTDGNDSDTLMRKATTAMDQAKRDGRDRLRFSTAALEHQVMRQMDLAHALYGALNREELRLLYQPQLDAKSGELVGAEVLLRWHHHRLGSVSPAEFIPIAENSGLILPIGEWVLQEAIRQLQRWQQNGLELPLLAVNLSAVQFRQQDLAERVLAQLEQAHLEPSRLELELTESVLIEEPEVAIAAMDRFSTAGIQLAIDDFGTGYSSLSYLKRLRVHKLKIDGSFVRDLGNSEHDSSIVQAIVNLAQGLGMRTIAEGVENERQLAVLREMGCDQIQGYFFAKPLDVAAFEEFARENVSRSVSMPPR